MAAETFLSHRQISVKMVLPISFFSFFLSVFFFFFFFFSFFFRQKMRDWYLRQLQQER